MGKLGCVNERVFFGLFAAFCVYVLCYGLSSGSMWLKFGSCQRAKNPVTFWFAAASWAIFAGISLWATIFHP